MELTEDLKREIWEKGIEDDKYPSDRVRKDACGAYIRYADYGNRDSIFGWEIDHIYPASKLKDRVDIAAELIDDIRNLRPFHWKNNESKGANYPFYTACMVADDENATNILTSQGKKVSEHIQEELRRLYNLDNQTGDGSRL